MIRKDAEGRASERDGLFAGENPFEIVNRWLNEARSNEINDPEAISLATVDSNGLPNLRMVLLKEIEPIGDESCPSGGMLFYTNRNSAKGQELSHYMGASALLHWKSLRRQIRFRGPVELVQDAKSDAYFASRHPQSRAGAIASDQSRPLVSRAHLIEKTDSITRETNANPVRPENWGGYRIRPVEFEFWADGEFRLHDRFKWVRESQDSLEWEINRLNP